MGRKSLGRQNRRVQGMLVPLRPSCSEEKEFVKAFGHMLNHAVATVAADPQVRYPSGSVAERVRRVYSKFQPARHPSAQRRAVALLTAPVEQRQRHFGRFHERGADFWKKAPRGLDAEVKQLLKKAVYSRLDSYRSDIKDYLDVLVATKRIGGSWSPPKTWLEVGFFSGDVVAGFQSQTISSPVTCQFRWWTEEEGAERGVWELVRKTKLGEIPVAAGDAGDAPQNIFEIDFGKYLPSQPPSALAKYIVRVVPGTRPKLIPTETQGEFKKVPGKAVGSPSEPVVITYSAVGTPPVQFDFVDIYQSLRFVLESIYLIEDQIGPGAEEFYVTGFVQESFRTESDQLGEQSSPVGGYAQLALEDDEIPDHAFLGGSHTFYLNKPGSEEWPRAYTVVISVLEKDSGGSLEDWQNSMTNVAKSMISDDFNQMVGDYLEEFFQEHVGDVADVVANSSAQLAQLVGSIFGFVGGWIGIVAGAIAMDIIYGSADDYYGAEVFVLVLTSNLVDEVHALPGKHISDGYVLSTGPLTFRGHTTYPEATSSDGEVEITFSFTFSNKVTTSI